MLMDDSQEEIVNFPKIEVLPDIHEEIKKFIKKNGFIVAANYRQLGANSDQAFHNNLQSLLKSRIIKREKRPVKIDGQRGHIVWVYTLNEK